MLNKIVKKIFAIVVSVNMFQFLNLNVTSKDNKITPQYNKINHV